MEHGSTNNSTFSELWQKIRELENRLIQLEYEIGVPTLQKENIPERTQQTSAQATATVSSSSDSDDALESRFGEHGMAWMGNLVLLTGIILLFEFLNGSGLKLFAFPFGYLASAGLFISSKFFRESHKTFSYLFTINAFLVAFYLTLRLHFFETDPLISGMFPSFAGAVIILLLMVAYGVRKEDRFICGLALAILPLSTLLSDSTHIILPLLVLGSGITTYLLFRFRWFNVFFTGLIIHYIAFIIWLINNPLMGNPIDLLPYHDYGIVYLFLIGGIFSQIAILPRESDRDNNIVIIGLIINAMAFSALTLLFVFSFYLESYSLLFGIIALFCLAFSVALNRRGDGRVTSALYILYGFMALSVTVYGIFGLPQGYMLLAWESLLVVSMALWFRSRLIVIMNTILFVLILLAYLGQKHHFGGASFSFAIVAIITARIINWKKNRLEVKTQLLRNTYLISGFFMILYALYHALPGQYVTISWLLSAVAFFLLSIILKNVKYRYLALATIVATIFYLFLVDLARIEPLYRIIAFMVVAVTSLMISLYYSKRKNVKKD